MIGVSAGVHAIYASKSLLHTLREKEVGYDIMNESGSIGNHLEVGR